jgi:hypothetical protein
VTTRPERHTGEGVFFTSKAADALVFRSHRLELAFDNLRHDVRAGSTRHVGGTDVTFRIQRRSRRDLRRIFEAMLRHAADHQHIRKVDDRLTIATGTTVGIR